MSRLTRHNSTVCLIFVCMENCESILSFYFLAVALSYVKGYVAFMVSQDPKTRTMAVNQ